MTANKSNAQLSEIKRVGADWGGVIRKVCGKHLTCHLLDACYVSLILHENLWLLVSVAKIGIFFEITKDFPKKLHITAYFFA